MKTQNNNQPTGFSQVSKSVVYSSAVLLSVGLFSMTASAQDFWKQFSNSEAFNKMTTLVLDQASELENNVATLEINNADLSNRLNRLNETLLAPEKEAATEVEPWMTDGSFFYATAQAIEESLEYNPAKFIDEEMAAERANLVNGEEITIEEPVDYNPAQFVAQEMAAEIESPVTTEEVTIEEPVNYNPAQFVEEEMEAERANLVNEEEVNIEASLEYNPAKFVEEEMATETEPALEIESWMTDDSFFTSLELATENEVDQQIAKYAQQIDTALETEPALEVESWMTDESFFKAAEIYTAKGADQEIEKFAQQISFQANNARK